MWSINLLEDYVLKNLGSISSMSMYLTVAKREGKQVLDLKESTEESKTNTDEDLSDQLVITSSLEVDPYNNIFYISQTVI